MSFRQIPETGEAVLGKTYRSTWWIGGPYPPRWITDGVSRAIIATAKATGRVKVLSTESFAPGFLPGGPARAWAFRVTWQKQGSGTPLLFFTGPGGILTLAIVGVIVAVAGAVILARTLEELVDELPDFAAWVPAVILGSVLVLGLVFRGKVRP